MTTRNIQREARKIIGRAALMDPWTLPIHFIRGDRVEDTVDRIIVYAANFKTPTFSHAEMKALKEFEPDYAVHLPPGEAPHASWHELLRETSRELLDTLSGNLPNNVDMEALDKIGEEMLKESKEKMSDEDLKTLEKEMNEAFEKKDFAAGTWIQGEIKTGASLKLIRLQRKIRDIFNEAIRPIVMEWAGPATPSMSGRR